MHWNSNGLINNWQNDLETMLGSVAKVQIPYGGNIIRVLTEIRGSNE